MARTQQGSARSSRARPGAVITEPRDPPQLEAIYGCGGALIGARSRELWSFRAGHAGRCSSGREGGVCPGAGSWAGSRRTHGPGGGAGVVSCPHALSSCRQEAAGSAHRMLGPGKPIVEAGKPIREQEYMPDSLTVRLFLQLLLPLISKRVTSLLPSSSSAGKDPQPGFPSCRHGGRK